VASRPTGHRLPTARHAICGDRATYPFHLKRSVLVRHTLASPPEVTA
jgi:hypothetical protein